MEFLSTIADAIFGWALNANEASYSKMVNLEVPAWVLLMLFIVTIGAVCTFYYGIAKNVANATNKNYIIVFFLGILVLWLVNLIIVPTIVDEWDYAFESNNIILSLVDTVFYMVLYEIISIFAKDQSNAKHIHLLNCWS